MFGFGKKGESQPGSPDMNERAEKQKEEQKQIGADILEKLKLVIDEVKEKEDAPNLVLGKLEDNAGKYSITLHIKDSFGTHFLRGFDVNLQQEAEELSIQKGPYKENEYYGLDQMDEFLEQAKKEVSEAK